MNEQFVGITKDLKSCCALFYFHLDKLNAYEVFCLGSEYFRFGL